MYSDTISQVSLWDLEGVTVRGVGMGKEEEKGKGRV